VAASAETVYAALTRGQQEIARRLFLRLVAVGQDTDDARRLVGPAELSGLSARVVARLHRGPAAQLGRRWAADHP
jgi:hypothetical protein